MIKNIIFDCDGVLVDSEMIANRVEAEVKTEHGFPTTTEEQIEKFVGFGLNHPTIKAELDRLPSQYLALVDERIKAVYASELRAIGGVAELLDGLAHPKCVASSSLMNWLEYKLTLTGLWHHFPNAVFSGHMVKRGKPEPDLFLFAADRMGWKASECLVIEDSVAGVTAGRAAGMTVCGFLGASHIFPGHDERLRKAGADYIITDMSEVMALVKF